MDSVLTTLQFFLVRMNLLIAIANAKTEFIRWKFASEVKETASRLKTQDVGLEVGDFIHLTF